jgi:hypothetical protein
MGVIGSGLTRLQPLLTECLGYRNGGMMTKCHKPPRYVPYKGTYVPYDGTFGASDQGQTLDV